MTIRRLIALLAFVSPYVLAQPVPSYCDVDTSGADWAYRCKVKLTVDNDGNLLVSNDPLGLPSGLSVKVVWVLTQSKYFFESGDGIKLQNSSGQFSSACSTSDEQGKCIVASKPHKFRWIIRNDQEFSEPYCIVFHDNNNRVYSYDPTIANSFGFVGRGSGIPAVIHPSDCAAQFKGP